MASSLLRDWGLLREQVVPPLLEVGAAAPRVWAIGDPADAVAISVALAEVEGEPVANLRSFTHEIPSDLSSLSFGTGDVRCLPLESRTAWFHRREHRWVPKPAIAEQVVLGAPSAPVDLITVRHGRELDDMAVDRLREGGHLLVVDPPRSDRAPDLRDGTGIEMGICAGRMQAVGDDGRLYRKLESIRSGRTSKTNQAVLPGEAGTEDEAMTLADRQRQEDLVLEHLELAKALARRFANRGQPMDDLEQVTRLALLKAAKRFDPSRGNAFASYATANILGELKRYFRDKTWAMRVPRPLQELHLAAKEACDQLGQTLGASPKVAQVAEHLGVSEEDVLESMEAGSTYRVETLEVSGPEDGRAREIPVTDASLEQVLDRERLRAALPRLDRTERIILKGLYFEGRTQQDLSGELGVSQMQISRLHARACAKLRR
jgi:RNA polymerase sigma-B factor